MKKPPKRKRSDFPRINVPLEPHHQLAIRAIMARLLRTTTDRVSQERAIQHAIERCAEAEAGG